MKVYVVTDWYKHEEVDIRGVFASIEKAREFAQTLLADALHDEGADRYFTDIEEYEVQ